MNNDKELQKAYHQFIITISHEIRTALNASIGLSFVVAENDIYPFIDSIKDISSQVGNACKNSQMAWNDLITLHKMLNFPDSLAVATINTSELIKWIDNNLENHWLLSDKKVKVTSDSISISDFKASGYEIESALIWIIAEMVGCCSIKTDHVVEIAIRSFQKGDQVKLVIFHTTNFESHYKMEDTLMWPFIKKIIHDQKGQINIHTSEADTPVVNVSLPLLEASYSG